MVLDKSDNFALGSRGLLYKLFASLDLKGEDFLQVSLATKECQTAYADDFQPYECSSPSANDYGTRNVSVCLPQIIVN